MSLTFEDARRELSLLAGCYGRGEITVEDWQTGVTDVLVRFDPSLAARAVKWAGSTAPAPPRPRERSQTLAAKGAVVLADRDAVDSRYVKGHAS